MEEVVAQLRHLLEARRAEKHGAALLPVPLGAEGRSVPFDGRQGLHRLVEEPRIHLLKAADVRVVAADLLQHQVEPVRRVDAPVAHRVGEELLLHLRLPRVAIGQDVVAEDAEGPRRLQLLKEGLAKADQKRRRRRLHRTDEEMRQAQPRRRRVLAQRRHLEPQVPADVPFDGPVRHALMHRQPVVRSPPLHEPLVPQ
eukprot:scaffold803_cov310-Pinguiococcus_pyrenoidosus.AAC.8